MLDNFESREEANNVSVASVAATGRRPKDDEVNMRKATAIKNEVPALHDDNGARDLRRDGMILSNERLPTKLQIVATTPGFQNFDPDSGVCSSVGGSGVSLIEQKAMQPKSSRSTGIPLEETGNCKLKPKELSLKTCSSLQILLERATNLVAYLSGRGS